MLGWGGVPLDNKDPEETLVLLEEKNLGNRTDKRFQIFDKSFYRKYTTYVLMSRAGPKIEVSQGTRLQLSLLEPFKNGGSG